VTEPTTLTRYGKTAAVVVSADWFDRARDMLGNEGGEAR
jgi:PHD/YefM family antitoxin component YafN of YafNO toxin-antitoxin module